MSEHSSSAAPKDSPCQCGDPTAPGVHRRVGAPVEACSGPIRGSVSATCSRAAFHEFMSMQCEECGYQPGPVRPVNTTVWIIGPDDAPTAIEYEQSDGKVYLLCKVSEADATGLGMFVAQAAMAMGMNIRQSLESRRA